MKVTCDNCGAVYRIPEEKLTKEVSRATCKRCGNKIVIRKPSAMTSTLGASYDFDEDDDGVINHEERTVIATVPELQKFDSAPPVSIPSPMGDSGMGQLPNIPSATESVPETKSPETPPATESTEAADTSKASLSQANSLVSGSASDPSSSGVSAVQLAAQGKMDMGPLPMAMVGLSIVGTVLLVYSHAWSENYITVAGFFMALFGQVAVLMALVDLKNQRQPRPAAVFGVPALVCIGLFLLLFVAQGRESMAFLGAAPEVMALADGESVEWEYVTEVDKKTGKTTKVRRKKRRKTPKSNQPTVESTAIASVETGPVGPGSKPNIMAEMGFEKDTKVAGGPKTNRFGEARSKIQHDKGILTAKSGTRAVLESAVVPFQKCWEKNGGGDTSKIGKLQVSVYPSGELKSAGLPTKSAFKGSRFESCLKTQASKLKYPSFESKKHIVIEHTLRF